MSLFGAYYAATSPMHRAPVWSKYLAMLAIGFVPFVAANMWVSAVALACAVTLLLVVARIPALLALPLPIPLLLMMSGLVAYHALATTPMRGALYVINVVTVVYLARLITFTTTSSALIDAIALGARPLRAIGADPEKIALAVALMWRSVPHLVGIFGAVRDSARARGLNGLSPRYLIPGIIQAVGFGLATSDALRARGLD